jgi:hypothetical protein
LGDYPGVTLGEAREKSEAARKLVKDGDVMNFLFNV